MEKINLKNMPYNQLYEFANGYYVWKILRAHGTRNGNYLSNDPTPQECTEVFRKENDNSLGIVWSGRLITNSGVFNEECLDSTGCFSIFSHDEDTSARFHQDHKLKIAPLELQREAIEEEKQIVNYIQQRLSEQQKRHL